MLVARHPSLTQGGTAPADVSEGDVTETAIDPMCDRGWDSLIGSHPDCTFFHSAAWARTLCKAYGHRPLYRAYWRDEKIVALIPMIEIDSAATGCRGVCLPFTDFCEPLVFDPASAGMVRAKLLRLAQERGWKYLEIRGASSVQSKKSSSAGTFYGHSLDLRSGSRAIFEGFSSSARRAIRKAQRSDVKVCSTNTQAAIVEYYRLHSETRKRHGVPPQPLSFFLSLHDQVISRGFGFVSLASIGSRAIAGAVFLHFGQRAVFKYGASDVAFQEFRANNLVFWEAIKNLSSSGFTALHFGRTSMENESLRRFKLGWGTREETIEYVKLQENDAAEGGRQKQLQRLSAAFFRRMPSVFNRWVGSVLYPHLD